MMLVLINAVNSIHYQPMLNAIASMVLDKKSPNYHALRVFLLRDTKNRFKFLLIFIICIG
jgi:hypothetical protein